MTPFFVIYYNMSIFDKLSKVKYFVFFNGNKLKQFGLKKTYFFGSP